MFGFIFRPRYVVAFFALWLCAARAGAEPLGEPVATSAEASAPPEKVLLLKSGGTLQGQVSLEGDRYHVTRANGQIEVPVAKVSLVCSSLEDAYEQQRSQVPHNTADAHLGLAEWCLRYDLVQQADQELTEARALEPRNGKLALLERRLAVARQTKEAPPAAVAETAEARELLPVADEVKQLEAKVADLPEGVIERFSRKVQPILVNNCTASGCHQPAGKQEFQLDRAVLHGLSNRRTTLRNLTAALAQVDHASPTTSRLLTMSTCAHGGMKQPVLGPRQAELSRQLQEWVALVTDTLTAEDETTVADDDTKVKPKTADRHTSKHAHATASHVAGHRTPIDATKFAIGADGVIKKAAESEDEAVADKAEVATASDEQEESLFPSRPVRHGVERVRPKPQDPFDPEVFNRLSKNAANGTGATGTAAKVDQQPATR